MSVREAAATFGPIVTRGTVRSVAMRATALTSAAIAASSFNRTLGVIADRWALRILRDSFAGVRRFEEFQACSGAPRSTLAARLRGLVDRGVLERIRYNDVSPRYEYRLSARGADLYGATLLLLGWEQVWMPRSAALQPLRHNACGHVMTPELICSVCGRQAAFENTAYEILPPSGRGRIPAPLFRRASRLKTGMDGVAARSPARFTDIIGDRWSWMVLCAGFLGLRRFDEIQRGLRVATNILTHRLNQLVEHGLCSRHHYCEHARRYEYCLTPKGRELFPAAFMLTQWGDRWLAPASGGNLRVYHECGEPLRGVVSCGRCAAEIRLDEVNFPVRRSSREQRTRAA